MSSFARFKKFVVNDLINLIFQQHDVPASQKLALSSKAAAYAWKHYIIQPIYNRYGVRNEAQGARIKKKAAAEIDNAVNDLYYRLNRTNENWSENQQTELIHEVMTVLEQGMENNEGAEFVQ